MTCHHCHETIDASALECGACGGSVEAPAAMRMGPLFETYVGAVLPPFCVKCDQPARAERWRKTYLWHEPWLYVTMLAGLIIYFIIAMCVRKQFVLAVPLCEEHYRKPRRLRWIALIVFLATLGFAIAGIVSQKDAFMAFGCVAASLGTIAALVMLIVADRTLLPKRITDESAQFSGACEAFLSRLG